MKLIRYVVSFAFFVCVLYVCAYGIGAVPAISAQDVVGIFQTTVAP